MKISEIIPPELPDIALRTLQGLMTSGDHDYLQEHCGIEVLESWFCEDGSIELDIKLDDGSITTVDLSDAENICKDLSNYSKLVYYSLVENAAKQLPSWVYNSEEFAFDWSNRDRNELTLLEFDTVYEKVWDMVFNNGNPGWRKVWQGSPDNLWDAKMSWLEAGILRTMFGYNSQQNDPLPSWLIEGTIPLSRDFVGKLREIRQCLVDECPQDTDTYVSPFTGKPV
jgi:hypothetical protein